jgi:hypothetical protein
LNYPLKIGNETIVYLELNNKELGTGINFNLTLTGEHNVKNLAFFKDIRVREIEPSFNEKNFFNIIKKMCY